MITRRDVYERLKHFPPQVIVRHRRNGKNQDIINWILKDHASLKAQAKAIAPLFTGGTYEEIARKVYSFLDTQIVYKKDDSGQDIKWPSSLVRIGSGDCKSYSLFANLIFDELNVPFAYRFASYDKNPIPTHAYSYYLNGLIPVPIDAVYRKGFNKQKPYTFKKDYMRIRSIGGTDSPQVSRIPMFGFDEDYNNVVYGIGKPSAKKAAKKVANTEQKTANKAEKTQKKATKQTAKTTKKTENKAKRSATRTKNKAKVKAKVDKVKGAVKKKVTKVKASAEKLKKSFKTNVKNAAKGIKKIAKGAKKVGLTPVRQAFFALLKLNVRALATNLSKLNAKNPQAVKAMWEKYAGNYNQLIKVVNQSKNKKPLLGGKNWKKEATVTGIGIATEAIIGLIAAATPIIVAVVSLFAKNKIGTEEETTEFAQLTQEAYSESGGNAAMDDYADNSTSGGSAGSYDDSGEEEADWSSGDTQAEGTEATGPGGKTEKRKENTSGGMSISPMMIGLGIVAAIALTTDN